MSRPDLVADCARCAAVCCVATSFEQSDDFALTKAAGVGCRYLTRDCRCAIHGELAARGFPGCAVYDCHGAGPRVTRAFTDPHDAHARDQAFLVLRVVHELLWLLTEATALCPPSAGELRTQLLREIEALDAIAVGPGLDDVDLSAHRAAARAVLRRVGEALGGRRRARGLAVVR